MLTYNEAHDWASVSAKPPGLLLGNGFSVAQNYEAFSYRALLRNALASGRIGPLAESLFEALRTEDFEVVIESLKRARQTLRILNEAKYTDEISALDQEEDQLKEALAQVLASLHPSRPNEIPDDDYRRVRAFLSGHRIVYTANYDLLLYWATMNETPFETFQLQVRDDGFRDAGNDEPYVVWNYLSPHTQTIHYIHGALHLYRDVDRAELQKITWSRTGDALIDQIRAQLNRGVMPLIVTEGTSTAKLTKIQTSDYLSKSLRSLAQANFGFIAYGLSFSTNDTHIMKAIVESKIQRLAVSIYGDPGSDANQATIDAVSRLPQLRAERSNSRTPLDVDFFDASSVALWSAPAEP